MVNKELYDSWEEYYFQHYINELVYEGYVLWSQHHPDSFKLFDGMEYMVKRQLTRLKRTTSFTDFRRLLHPHSYQCDFLIQWAPKAEGVFYKKINSIVEGDAYFFAQEHNGKMMSLIDIKGGGYNSRLSSDIQFPLNQKWVMSKFGLYVQKAQLIVAKKKGTSKVYSGLFPETFTPDRYLKTDGGHKSRTIHFEHIPLLHFINKIKFKHYG